MFIIRERFFTIYIVTKCASAKILYDLEREMWLTNLQK